MDSLSTSKKAFSLVAGILYCVVGLLEILAGLGIAGESLAPVNITGGILDGAILIVAGAVFLVGAKRMMGGAAAGESFLYVGIMLSLLFAAVYLLLFGGELLMAYVIRSEDYIGWSPIDGIVPALYASVVPLAGYMAWKGHIGLNSISKAGV